MFQQYFTTLWRGKTTATHSSRQSLEFGHQKNWTARRCINKSELFMIINRVGWILCHREPAGDLAYEEFWKEGRKDGNASTAECVSLTTTDLKVHEVHEPQLSGSSALAIEIDQNKGIILQHMKPVSAPIRLLTLCARFWITLHHTCNFFAKSSTTWTVKFFRTPTYCV